MFRLARPLHLLLATLTYAFGASLTDYLGKSFRAGPFWFGLVVVLLLLLAMNLLSELYRNEPLQENETRKDRLKKQNNLLYLSIASLGSVAVIAYVLFNTNQLPISSFFFLLFSIVLLVAYSIPPFRFLNRGFGELLIAVLLAYVIPSISFTLQAETTHPYLALTIPLTFLAFAYFIILDFQSFAQDQKFNRVTFLTRLGWERVVPLHHVLVLLTYVLFLVMSAFNVSLTLIAPAFITFPFAIFQVMQLRNIALGAKPNWTLLHATALAVFGLTVYFLTLTFWLR